VRAGAEIIARKKRDQRGASAHDIVPLKYEGAVKLQHRSRKWEELWSLFACRFC